MNKEKNKENEFTFDRNAKLSHMGTKCTIMLSFLDNFNKKSLKSKSKHIWFPNKGARVLIILLSLEMF
jgi:hypothetical protein